MRIVIVDDCTKDRQRLVNSLRSWANKRKTDLVICECPSGDAFIEKMTDLCNDCDGVFLDISMQGKNGIDVARELCEREKDVSKVFYSSLVEYVYTGYTVNAVRYILKTAQNVEEQIEECMDCLFELYAEKHSEKHEIVTKFGSHIYISYADVLYITGARNYSELHTRDEVIVQRLSLGKLESKLPEQFARCSRSAFANIRHVKRITKNNITFSNGDVISIGEKYSDSFMEKFIDLQ